MTTEFIPYEQALELKELGFDEPCFMAYLGEELYSKCDDVYHLQAKDVLNPLKAPLYQQAFRWFREKFDKLHTVNVDLSDNLEDRVYIYTIEDHLRSIVDRSEEYQTYEESELACLNKLIEIVKDGK